MLLLLLVLRASPVLAECSGEPTTQPTDIAVGGSVVTGFEVCDGGRMAAVGTVNSTVIRQFQLDNAWVLR